MRQKKLELFAFSWGENNIYCHSRGILQAVNNESIAPRLTQDLQTHFNSVGIGRQLTHQLLVTNNPGLR